MAIAQAAGALQELVVFHLDGQRYALHLPVVQRISSMVQITPLPQAPDVVQGVINVQGEVVPVVDLRRRFGLPERTPTVQDHLVLARTSRRRLAFAADRVDGVLRAADNVIPAAVVVPGLPHVEGIVTLPDGMILIHDLDRFLSWDEERALDQALATA